MIPSCKHEAPISASCSHCSCPGALKKRLKGWMEKSAKTEDTFGCGTMAVLAAMIGSGLVLVMLAVTGGQPMHAPPSGPLPVVPAVGDTWDGWKYKWRDDRFNLWLGHLQFHLVPNFTRTGFELVDTPVRCNIAVVTVWLASASESRDVTGRGSPSMHAHGQPACALVCVLTLQGPADQEKAHHWILCCCTHTAISNHTATSMGTHTAMGLFPSPSF